MEDGNSTMMRIAVTYVGYGFWNYDDVVYVTYEGTCDYVEEDVITVYGIFIVPPIVKTRKKICKLSSFPFLFYVQATFCCCLP